MGDGDGMDGGLVKVNTVGGTHVCKLRANQYNGAVVSVHQNGLQKG